MGECYVTSKFRSSRAILVPLEESKCQFTEHALIQTDQEWRRAEFPSRDGKSYARIKFLKLLKEIDATHNNHICKRSAVTFRATFPKSLSEDFIGVELQIPSYFLHRKPNV